MAATFSDWNDVTAAGRNELVFENKNKEYGAYLIRKKYNRTIILIYVICGLSFILVMAAPRIISYFAGQMAEEMIIPDVTLEDLQAPPPLDKTEPPPPPPPPPPVQATVQFVPPEITDEEIPEEEVQQVVDEKTQISVVSNEGTDEIMIPEEVVTVVETTEQIFTVVEQMPEFPGGEAALYKYLNSNIKYPQMEADAHIQGTVYLTFVVDKDGNIKDVKPLRGVAGGPNLEKEAMRVVKSMPSWKSGKQNGRPVSVQYNLPVRFVLK